MQTLTDQLDQKMPIKHSQIYRKFPQQTKYKI